MEDLTSGEAGTSLDAGDGDAAATNEASDARGGCIAPDCAATKATACENFNGSLGPGWALQSRDGTAMISDGGVVLSIGTEVSYGESAPQLVTTFGETTRLRCAFTLRLDEIGVARQEYVLLFSGGPDQVWTGLFLQQEGSGATINLEQHPFLNATATEELVGNLQQGVPTRIALEITVGAITFTRSCTSKKINNLVMDAGTTFTKASFTLRPRSEVGGPAGRWQVVFDDALCEAGP